MRNRTIDNDLHEMRKRVFSPVVGEDEQSDKAKAISLTLTPSARAGVERIKAELGTPHSQSMARILEWFTAQDWKFQIAVLTRNQDAKRELMRGMLQDMAAQEKGAAAIDASAPLKPDEIVRLIHVLADRLGQINSSLAKEVAASQRKSK